MKSKKKLLTIAFLLVIIGVIFTVFYLKKLDDKKTLSKDKPTEERGQKEVEPSKKEEEREETDVKPQEEESATKTEENKKEVVKPTPNVKTQPKVVQKPKPTNKPQVKPQPKVQPTPKPTPQPKPKQEQKPWEKLGLTEDQYKNQPMYSWEKVDFKTREECINYGNTHAPFSTGEGGYECSEVTSYTRTLGWDWEPRYLKGK